MGKWSLSRNQINNQSKQNIKKIKNKCVTGLQGKKIKQILSC